MTARAGPPTVPCQICGRRFGTRSIKIHEPQCNRRSQMQNDSLVASHRDQPDLRKRQSAADDLDNTPSMYPVSPYGRRVYTLEFPLQPYSRRCIRHNTRRFVWINFLSFTISVIYFTILAICFWRLMWTFLCELVSFVWKIKYMLTLYSVRLHDAYRRIVRWRDCMTRKTVRSSEDV